MGIRLGLESHSSRTFTDLRLDLEDLRLDSDSRFVLYNLIIFWCMNMKETPNELNVIIALHHA